MKPMATISNLQGNKVGLVGPMLTRLTSVLLRHIFTFLIDLSDTTDLESATHFPFQRLSIYSCIHRSIDPKRWIRSVVLPERCSSAATLESLLRYPNIESMKCYGGSE